MTSDSPPKLINGQNIFLEWVTIAGGIVLLENPLPAGRMLLSTARDLAQVPTVCLFAGTEMRIPSSLIACWVERNESSMSMGCQTP